MLPSGILFLKRFETRRIDFVTTVPYARSHSSNQISWIATIFPFHGFHRFGENFFSSSLSSRMNHRHPMLFKIVKNDRNAIGRQHTDGPMEKFCYDCIRLHIFNLIGNNVRIGKQQRVGSMDLAHQENIIGLHSRGLKDPPAVQSAWPVIPSPGKVKLASMSIPIHKISRADRMQEQMMPLQ